VRAAAPHPTAPSGVAEIARSRPEFNSWPTKPRKLATPGASFPVLAGFDDALRNRWQAWRELLRRLEYIAFFREFLVGMLGHNRSV